ncbi:MAG: hypothetical protein IT249_00340, partial [Chitinophagaceae bacterium]|nr:hypothetical protein [Chitinophagaceae bacterium]
DNYGREIAKKQWDQIIINGIVKGNVGQMFKALPDTSVYQGYRWTVQEKQEGELPMDIETSFIIKEINEGQVIVVSESNMKSTEGAITNMPGQKDVQTELKGKRAGVAYIDINDGMIVKSKYVTDISGFVNVMGIKTPISIITNLNVNRGK